MHILIVDASVMGYKAFMRLFSQDYTGETADEEAEFTSQFVSEIIYLKELHKPDGIIFAMDCPRPEVWRHKVVQRFYGPKTHATPIEWMPGTKVKTAESACRWMVECFNSYKVVWLDADGSFKSKHLTKSKYNEWAKEEAEKETAVEQLRDIPTLKKMLPVVAKMYKGQRKSSHWPASAHMDKEMFKAKSQKLIKALAPILGARIVGAAELEADDIAYAVCDRWHYHDITVATVDKDWSQLGLQMQQSVKTVDGEQIATPREHGKFQFWDVNKYEFMDTTPAYLRRMFFEKLLTGDSSDNIESARLKGQTAGIGPKKCDKIFDEVPLENMYSWLKEHGDLSTLARNSTLMNLERCPEDLKERAMQALLDSKEQLSTKPEVKLTDIASEATLHMAKIEGQKARQLHVIQGGKQDGQ